MPPMLKPAMWTPVPPVERDLYGVEAGDGSQRKRHRVCVCVCVCVCTVMVGEWWWFVGVMVG